MLGRGEPQSFVRVTLRLQRSSRCPVSKGQNSSRPSRSASLVGASVTGERRRLVDGEADARVRVRVRPVHHAGREPVRGDGVRAERAHVRCDYWPTDAAEAGKCSLHIRLRWMCFFSSRCNTVYCRLSEVCTAVGSVCLPLVSRWPVGGVLATLHPLY